MALSLHYFLEKKKTHCFLKHKSSSNQLHNWTHAVLLPLMTQDSVIIPCIHGYIFYPEELWLHKVSIYNFVSLKVLTVVEEFPDPNHFVNIHHLVTTT
jgi:hypothetical protein